MTSDTLSIILLLLGLTLIGVLLLQVRGTAGQIFGETESTFRSRRGIERLLFRATVVIAIIFIVIAIINARIAD